MLTHLPVPPRDFSNLELFLLWFLFVASQSALVYWKQRSLNDFGRGILLLFWTLPLLSLEDAWMSRALVIWVLFTAVMTVLIRLSLQKPIVPATARYIIHWLFYFSQVTCLLTLCGYIVTIGDYASGLFLGGESYGHLGLSLVVYGVYYGLLARGGGEACLEHLVPAHVHDLPTQQVNKSTCGICQGPLVFDFKTTTSQDSIMKLEGCGHDFHEMCLQGWAIVGRKDSCPHCSSRFPLGRTFVTLSEMTSLFWGRFLDTVGYFLVWSPTILALLYATGVLILFSAEFISLESDPQLS